MHTFFCIGTGQTSPFTILTVTSLPVTSLPYLQSVLPSQPEPLLDQEECLACSWTQHTALTWLKLTT